MEFTITILDERVERIDKTLATITYETVGPEPDTKIKRRQFPGGTADWLKQVVGQNLDQLDPHYQMPEVVEAQRAVEEAVRAAEEVRRRASGVLVGKKGG